MIVIVYPDDLDPMLKCNKKKPKVTDFTFISMNTANGYPLQEGDVVIYKYKNEEIVLYPT